MLKIILSICILFLTGCSTISLEDRFGDKNKANIKEVLKSCPSQGTEILRDHVYKSFLEGDKAGRDGDYNASTVAKEFLLFAIAAENAYLDEKFDDTSNDPNSRRRVKENFYVERYDPNWEFQKRVPLGAGLALDYYFNNQDVNVFKVLVAFRGTEPWSWDDWVNGNFSPVTEWLPGQNQYQLARKKFIDIRNKALEKAPDENKIYYYVTGHSLGGWFGTTYC